MVNKYFHISLEKEMSDTCILSQKIADDEWMDNNTVIVVCSPEYSSIQAQVLNHNLSSINDNELYEQLYIQMPYPTMSQVWNSETGKYELFDKYLADWCRKNLNTHTKYLFLDSGTLRGKNFSKTKMVLRGKLDDQNYRFASLYVQEDSVFTPDYYIEKFNKEKDGGLLFSWENPSNPNWDY